MSNCGSSGRVRRSESSQVEGLSAAWSRDLTRIGSEAGWNHLSTVTTSCSTKSPGSPWKSPPETMSAANASFPACWRTGSLNGLHHLSGVVTSGRVKASLSIIAQLGYCQRRGISNSLFHLVLEQVLVDQSRGFLPILHLSRLEPPLPRSPKSPTSWRLSRSRY